MLVYFWGTIVRIIRAWFRSLARQVPRNDPDARMGWLIIIGTIPIGVLGFLFQDVIRGTFRNLWLVAIVLIVFGLLLGAADRCGKRTRELTDLTYPHGLALGFAQALALIPGVSRSGATTTLGLALGYTRPAAARVRVPARRAGGVRQRPLRAAPELRGAGRAVRPRRHRGRDGRRLRRRSRGDRVPDAVPQARQLPAVRDLPRSRSACC